MTALNLVPFMPDILFLPRAQQPGSAAVYTRFPGTAGWAAGTAGAEFLKTSRKRPEMLVA